MEPVIARVSVDIVADHSSESVWKIRRRVYAIYLACSFEILASPAMKVPSLEDLAVIILEDVVCI